MKVSFKKMTTVRSGLRLIPHIIAVLALIVAAGALNPGKAQAAYLGTFSFVNSGGKCLDVTGVSTADGAYMQLYTCLPSQYNQQFNVFSTAVAGVVEIQAVHSGKCLDVQFASGSDGARLIQQTCNGNANQRFLWTWSGVGADYHLKPQHVVNKCVQVSGSLANGSSIVQGACNTSANARWTENTPI